MSSRDHKQKRHVKSTKKKKSARPAKKPTERAEKAKKPREKIPGRELSASPPPEGFVPKPEPGEAVEPKPEPEPKKEMVTEPRAAPEPAEARLPPERPEALARPGAAGEKQWTWVEVRGFPGPERDAPPACFTSVIDHLYGTGEPFEFLVAGMPSPDRPEQHEVRWFLRVSSPGLAGNIVANLRGHGLWAATTDPPELEAEYELPLQLCDHFAIPVIPLTQSVADPMRGPLRPEGTRTDIAFGIQLASSLVGGGALRITARGDTRGAQREIHSWIHQGASGFFAGIGRSVADFLTGTAREVGRLDGSDDARIDSQRRRLEEAEHRRSEVQRRQATAVSRLSNPLFACDVTIYGKGDQLPTILGGLPNVANSFSAFGVPKPLARPVDLSSPPHRPSRREAVRNLKPIALATFPILLFVALIAGWFQPLRLSPLDTALIVAAVAPMLFIWHLWRIPRPVVLEGRELALLVSIPPGFSNLPVAAPEELPGTETQRFEPSPAGARAGFVSPGSEP